MNFEEYAGKALLKQVGIAVPHGILAHTATEAAAAAKEIGPCVVKAQVTTGKRGKAGGIKVVNSPAEAKAAAEQIIGMHIGEHRVEKVWVEEQGDILHEYYAAVLTDPVTKSPLVIFSAVGGMDIEEIAESQPNAMRKMPVDISKGFDMPMALTMLDGLLLGPDVNKFALFLCQLYQAFVEFDAELLEVNPLVRLSDDSLAALDCKYSMDDSAIVRKAGIAANATPDKLSSLEAAAKGLGLQFIELDGNIGVIANGAGLTMTTMDVITHYGGRPANFLEIGGEAYTKATDALNLLLQKPGLKCLVVNFCGAFARTDVMTDGIISAWENLQPELPVFFSIHGTGATAARAMLKQRLHMTPYATMDDAIKAAVAVEVVAT